jgi:hypothetical protein
MTEIATDVVWALAWILGLAGIVGLFMGLGLSHEKLEREVEEEGRIADIYNLRFYARHRRLFAWCLLLAVLCSGAFAVLRVVS